MPNVFSLPSLDDYEISMHEEYHDYDPLRNWQRFFGVCPSQDTLPWRQEPDVIQRQTRLGNTVVE